MNKKQMLLTGVLVLGLLMSVGVYAYLSEGKKNMNNTDSSEVSMPNTDHDEMDHNKMDHEHNEEVTEGDKITTLEVKNYVTLAEYESDKTNYVDEKIVYFFHAPWCPICTSVKKEITSNEIIPESVTVVEVDFDTETELRQKYGVTTQTTFVQVDSAGSEVATWNPVNTQEFLAGIK